MDRRTMDELIDRHWKAEASGDLDAALGTLHPDVLHDVVGSPVHPLHGREAVRSASCTSSSSATGSSPARTSGSTPARQSRN
jgi:hypothetical protein